MKEETVVASPTKQVIVFKLADELLAADINEIREVIKLDEITPVPNSDEYVAGIINIRGKIVPVMDLAVVLKIGSSDANKKSFVLLIDAPDNAMVGMIVNEVAKIRRVSDEEIKEAPKLVKSRVAEEFILGVILLSEHSNKDEDVILYVDLEAIIDKSVAQVIEKITPKREKAEANEKEEK